MAARKNISHDLKTREKIRTSQLVNRLEKCAFGEVELTQQQIKAIEVLLRKSLPDLSSISIDHSGNVRHEVIRRIVGGDK